MNRYNLVYILLLFLTPLSMFAEDGIVITHFDNEEQAHVLATIGRLEVDGNHLRLIGLKGEELGYTEIKVGLRVAFTDVTDEQLTTRLVTPMPDFAYNKENGTLILEGLNTDTVMRIFTLDGQLRRMFNLQAKHENKVDLRDLPVGVYILQMGTQTLKLIKK